MRSLILLFALALAGVIAPAQAQQVLPGLTEGVHYRTIAGGKPYAALPAGVIEVAEVFHYTCPHCASFAPLLETWKAGLPAHARLVLVPAVFAEDDAYARLFFASQTARSQAVLHPRVFAAIHEAGTLPRDANVAQLQAFANGVTGANGKALAAALANDKALQPKLRHARDFAIRSDIPGTPSLVVAGRYLILGNSYQALLDNARAVVDALAPARRPLRAPPPVRPAAAPARP